MFSLKHFAYNFLLPCISSISTILAAQLNFLPLYIASLLERLPSSLTSVPSSGTKITLIPYYGAAKGQSLKITESPDGQIVSVLVVKSSLNPPTIPIEKTEIEIDPYELENPPLPSKYDLESDSETTSYNEYIKTIQSNAHKIVILQEKMKLNGQLPENEQKEYHQYMDLINKSVQKLVEMQDSNNTHALENREVSNSWIEWNNEKKDNKRKETNENTTKKETNENNEKEENHKDNESVAINLPPEDASVAEAKPIGLAVAGEGGVAASKPVATAIAGPGGLAVARPVGTAIAGVSPDQALVPIYAEQLDSHKKNSHKNKGDDHYLSKIINKYHQVN